MGHFYIHSFAVKGTDVIPVRVEVSITPGLPRFTIVGLPDTAVQEAKERVRAALIHSQLPYPRTRITVNLMPAELKKHGPLYDLPIALCILASQNKIAQNALSNLMCSGELGLSGSISQQSHSLLVAEASKQSQTIPLVLGQDCLSIPHIHASSHLTFLPQELSNAQICTNAPPKHVATFHRILDPFFDIAGQQFAKRALTISATGRHPILLIGPPGSGKSLLATRLPLLLPEPTEEEFQAIKRIYAIAGLANPEGRPFRSPHHHTTITALIGGGRIPSPGEVTLAHHGVLMLDELPEFSRMAIEALRQPLESGEVHISRERQSVTYPANALVVATMNPCPCGYAGFEQEKHICICSPNQIQAYRHRISGPILDRMHLTVEMPAVSVKDIATSYSKQTKRRASDIPDHYPQITNARNLLSKQKAPPNARMSSQARAFLERAFHTLALSMRSLHNAERIASTIASLRESDRIDVEDVSESLLYRSRLLGQ